MAPDPQRKPDAGNGDGQQPPQSLVAVSQGHVWKALVYSRTGEQKCGCPVCGGSLDGARRARYEQSLRETAGDL